MQRSVVLKIVPCNITFGQRIPERLFLKAGLVSVISLTRETRRKGFYHLHGQSGRFTVFQEKWYKDNQKSDCVSRHLSHIPVNRGIKSRLGRTNYSDLYEIVHPSLDLICSCLLTGEEYGKGLFTLSYKTSLTFL